MRVTQYGAVTAEVTGGTVVGIMGEDGVARFRGVPLRRRPLRHEPLRGPAAGH